MRYFENTLDLKIKGKIDFKIWKVLGVLLKIKKCIFVEWVLRCINPLLHIFVKWSDTL